MKYQEPFDQVLGSGAGWIDGNLTTGVPGSIPRASAFEQPMRELDHLIGLSGQTQSNSDLFQVTRAVRSGTVEYAVDAGTVNAVGIAYAALPHLAYTVGQRHTIKIGTTNTGPATLNVDGLGAIAIVRPDGRPLVARDLMAGGIARVVHDGVRFQLVSYVPTVGRELLSSLSALQAIPNNTETAIIWPNTPVLDTEGMFSAAAPTRYTIKAGVSRFRIQYEACFDANATGTRKARILMDNLYEGAGMPASRQQAASSTDVTILQGSGGIVDLPSLGLSPDGTHYLQLMVVQDSGAALNLRGANTWLAFEPLA